MHLEFLVEDGSGAALLNILVPRIIGAHTCPHTWNIHSYKGIGHIPRDLRTSDDPAKRMLLAQLPRVLRGYAKTPGVDRVVVVVDTDARDCRDFLAELTGVARACLMGSTTMFRLAIEEVEAWYLGDRQALLAAYPQAKTGALSGYVQDSRCGTWEVLANALCHGGAAAIKKSGWPLPGQLKYEWATTIGPLMDVQINESPSFCKFRDGLRRITA